MHPELAERARRQDGLFSIDDARAVGYTKSQIDAGVRSTAWDLLYEGVYRVAGAPATWRSELRAVTLAGRGKAAISHRSAAWIYSLPGGRDSLIELSCPRWRRMQRPKLVVHESTRLAPHDVSPVAGIPVTRPERVILELASIYTSPDYIERVLQSARRQRLITHASMLSNFERMAGRGRAGVQVLRAALERWQPSSRATESEMETTLLQVLRRRGLPEPVLQHEIYDAWGQFIARVDAAYPDWQIAIEYDSARYHADEWAVARDNSRRNRLLQAGYVTVVARHADLRSGGAELAGAIRAAAPKHASTRIA